MIKRVFLGKNLQSRVDRSDARLRRVLNEEQDFLSGEIATIFQTEGMIQDKGSLMDTYTAEYESHNPNCEDSQKKLLYVYNKISNERNQADYYISFNDNEMYVAVEDIPLSIRLDIVRDEQRRRNVEIAFISKNNRIIHVGHCPIKGSQDFDANFGAHWSHVKESMQYLRGELSLGEWEYLEKERRKSHTRIVRLIHGPVGSQVTTSNDLSMKLIGFLTTLWVHDQNPHLRTLLRTRGMKPATEILTPEM